MTEAMMNRSTVFDTVSNVLEGITRPVINVGIGPFITTGDDAGEDATDNALLRAATLRRAGRVFSSYKSLEELMQEAGD